MTSGWRIGPGNQPDHPDQIKTNINKASSMDRKRPHNQCARNPATSLVRHACMWMQRSHPHPYALQHTWCPGAAHEYSEVCRYVYIDPAMGCARKPAGCITYTRQPEDAITRRSSMEQVPRRDNAEKNQKHIIMKTHPPLIPVLPCRGRAKAYKEDSRL
jgi:hypothetical protein